MSTRPAETAPKYHHPRPDPDSFSLSSNALKSICWPLSVILWITFSTWSLGYPMVIAFSIISPYGWPRIMCCDDPGWLIPAPPGGICGAWAAEGPLGG